MWVCLSFIQYLTRSLLLPSLIGIYVDVFNFATMPSGSFLNISTAPFSTYCNRTSRGSLICSTNSLSLALFCSHVWCSKSCPACLLIAQARKTTGRKVFSSSTFARFLVPHLLYSLVRKGNICGTMEGCYAVIPHG